MNFNDELERNRRLAKKDWGVVIPMIGITFGIMMACYFGASFWAAWF